MYILKRKTLPFYIKPVYMLIAFTSCMGTRYVCKIIFQNGAATFESKFVDLSDKFFERYTKKL